VILAKKIQMFEIPEKHEIIRATIKELGKTRKKRFRQKEGKFGFFENEKYNPAPDNNRKISTPQLPIN
jgi:hypothetical protein